jgi:hypothetical protein
MRKRKKQNPAYEDRHTGYSNSLSSSRSRSRPSTNVPATAFFFARRVVSPPQQAWIIPCGHEMKMTDPAGAPSTCPWGSSVSAPLEHELHCIATRRGIAIGISLSVFTYIVRLLLLAGSALWSAPIFVFDCVGGPNDPGMPLLTLGRPERQVGDKPTIRNSKFTKGIGDVAAVGSGVSAGYGWD